MENAEKKRIAYMDFLKFISCLGVVIFHVASETWYSYEYFKIDNLWIIDNTYKGLLYSTLPVFVMITGANILDREISIRKIYAKYIPRVLFFLLVWGEIYYAFQYRVFNLNSIFKCLENILCGKAYTHLWYLYMLLGLYLITPVVSIVCRNANKSQMQYLMVLLFVFAFVARYLEAVFPSVVELKDALYLSFPNFLLFYIGGFYCKKYSISKSQKIVLYISTAIILGALIIYSNYESLIRNVPVETIGVLHLGNCLLSFSSFVIAKDMSKIIEDCRFITIINNFINPLNFGIYLIHFIVIKVLAENGIDGHFINPIFGIPILGLFVFLFCSLVVFVLSKIPILKKLIIW